MKLVNKTTYDTRTMKRCLIAITRTLPLSYRAAARRLHVTVLAGKPGYRWWPDNRVEITFANACPRRDFVAGAYAGMLATVSQETTNYAYPADETLTWYAWHQGFQWQTLPERAPRAPRQPKPPVVHTQAMRDKMALTKITAREKAWTSRLRRAETALKKLAQKRRYYEKKLREQEQTAVV